MRPLALAFEQSSLSPAGPQAERLASLFWFLTALLGLVLALVLGATAYAALRRRAARARDDLPVVEPPPDATPLMLGRLIPPDPVTERRSTRSIAAATFITAAILLALVVVSAATGRAMAAFQPGDAVEVEVVGRQWWWEFRYRGDLPSQTVVTANELHVPVGRAVKLHMEARDVIHSFWVPSLHGKRDLIPGRTSDLWLQADRPGTYRGQCAEFCGFQHAKMVLWVVAEPEDRFHQWLAHQRQPAPEPQTDAERRGKEVFLSRSCPLCHTVAGTSAAATTGPDLTHLASRGRIGAGFFPNDPDHLAAWLADPQDLKPGVKMPPNPLPREELDALAAYLESLR